MEVGLFMENVSMENLSDKIKIAQTKANVERNSETKNILQKKLRKLLLQQEIENLKRQIELLGI